MPVFLFETFSTCLNTSSIIHMIYMSFQKVSPVPGFSRDGGHLSLKMCAINEGNKWYSSSSKGPFHRKYRTFWSQYVIHSSVTDPADSISGKGWQALHLYCMNAFYLKLLLYREVLNALHLFLCQTDYLCPPYFVFVNGNNVLYLCFV